MAIARFAGLCLWPGVASFHVYTRGRRREWRSSSVAVIQIADSQAGGLVCGLTTLVVRNPKPPLTTPPHHPWPHRTCATSDNVVFTSPTITLLAITFCFVKCQHSPRLWSCQTTRALIFAFSLPAHFLAFFLFTLIFNEHSKAQSWLNSMGSCGYSFEQSLMIW